MMRSLLLLLAFICFWMKCDAGEDLELNLLKKLQDSKNLRSFCPVNYTKVEVSIKIGQLLLSESLEREIGGNRFGSCLVDLTIREKWNNPRLAYDAGNSNLAYITVNSVKDMWHPALSFPGELNWRTTTQVDQLSNVLAWVYPSGDVFFSFRILLEFPMHRSINNQRTCTVPIESFRCSTKLLELKWKAAEDFQFADKLQSFGMKKVVTQSPDLQNFTDVSVSTYAETITLGSIGDHERTSVLFGIFLISKSK